MKNVLILILSVFLLSSLNCATTKQEATKTDEAVSGPFDLTGTWIETENWRGCGSSEKRTKTWKITQ
jgi:hypothetical protein